jgi:cellulose biosynthesis protein BcsQ
MLNNERINGGESSNGAIASKSVAVGVRNGSSDAISEKTNPTIPNANQTKTKKIVSIYNVKGGVGKSTIARELAYKLGATLVDCDKGGVQEFMESVKVVKVGDYIPTDIDGDVLIYDFPGKDDERRTNVIKKSDLVIVPFTPTFYALQNTVDSFTHIWAINKNVMMIANMLKEDRDLGRSKDEMEEVLNRYDADIGEILILPLHYTRGLQSAENKGRAIYDLREESPINKLNYAKICGEIDKITDTVKRVINDGA